MFTMIVRAETRKSWLAGVFYPVALAADIVTSPLQLAALVTCPVSSGVFLFCIADEPWD